MVQRAWDEAVAVVHAGLSFTSVPQVLNASALAMSCASSVLPSQRLKDCYNTLSLFALQGLFAVAR
jgi:hypothetical protein